MRKRLSAGFWTSTLVLALAAFAGCQHSEPSESADGAASEAAGGGAKAAKSTPGGGGQHQAAPAARPLTLPAGTVLRVRTTNTLSTESVQSGETFTASLEEPLVDGGRTIAREGATVYGKVVNSDKGGRVKGRASLSVRLTELQAANGQRIAINTDSYGVQAASSKKKDATKVAIASGVGAAIGAIAGGGSGAAKGAGVGAGAGGGVVLATRGDAAVIPSESVLTFSLAEPVTIAEK